MRRDLFISMATCFIIIVLSINTEGRLCHSIDIRNHPRYLAQLKNCTVIVGYLKILLFDKVKDSDFSNYSFPDLTEITGYLLLFKINKLTSLNLLFPNLRVIRGTKLIGNYALIIFQMPHLQEIGLTNLLYIARGGVKVDYCPQLCNVDTIDWKKIGASKLDFTNKNYGICEPCPVHCNGFCWNSYQCQNLDIDKCHPECLGCTKYNSSSHCKSCKNFDDSGICVSKCPRDKYANKYVSQCVTEEDCYKIPNGTWWLFKNECISSCPSQYEQIDPVKGGCKYCGDNCVRNCDPNVVDSLGVLQEFYACTHVDGSLEIRVSDMHVAKELEQNLGKIVEIDNNLKIIRSSAITSLDFLKSLKVIRGEFIIYENRNLQKLWNFTNNFTLNILSKKIKFQNNPLLCFAEIEKLTDKANLKGFIDLEQFKESNGYKASCVVEDLNITFSVITSTNVVISWSPFEKLGNVMMIGYTIYYTEHESQNKILVPYESDDLCYEKGWNSSFVTNQTYNFTKLKPYSRYGFYIKAYSMTKLNVQTPIKYFMTLSDDPTEPLNLEAIAVNDNSVRLRWEPPESINGILSHYIITYFLEDDYLPMVEQRNYCRHPHGILQFDDISETITSYDWDSSTVSSNITNDENTTNTCICNQKQEVRIFQQDIATLCENDKDKLQSSGCNNFLYYINSESTGGGSSSLYKDEVIVMKRNSIKKAWQPKNHRFQEINIQNVNLTTYEIKNLKHFSLYIFLLSACNIGNDTTDKKKQHEQHCSPVVMSFTRTKKKKNADNIISVNVYVEKNNVYLSWSEPKEPNSLIVAYQVEYKRTDLEYSKSITECITRIQYQNESLMFNILKLLPGKYLVRVQATSLAGPGGFSEPNYFEILAPGKNMFWLYMFLLILIFLLTVGVVLIYHWRRKRQILDSIHLITSVNPDYAGIYIEDEWEVDRNDVIVLNELGKGSFGMVYQGLMKSKNLPCAIKTVNDNASVLDRIEFLNEGSVMKNFNDAYHIIKLLGIVSRGQPPYVIMELMERGDLKKYLYRCREPSQNLTMNEMYRMASEIADGMAYLAAKKYVHRDLAARNCMVHADRTVKIGDFGMARDIYETDYYRKETVGLLPVRWMAPESLADGVFTSDSDCWSYGVVLWEIATLAEQPYQGISNQEVFTFVKNGGKLNRPKECSDRFYEIMKSCWEWKPNNRPTFRNIVESLVNCVGEDFKLVAFCYSKKGKEFALNAGPRPFNPAAMITTNENKVYGQYNVSQEDINLFVGETNRPKNYPSSSSFSSPDQRYRKKSPHYPTISPGSPDSYSLNSDSS